MRRWEYKQVIGNPESYETGGSFETDLNDLGGDGWELIHLSVIHTTSPITFIGFLKREVQEGPTATPRELSFEASSFVPSLEFAPAEESR